MIPLRERVARVFLEPAEPESAARSDGRAEDVAPWQPPTHWLPPTTRVDDRASWAADPAGPARSPEVAPLRAAAPILPASLPTLSAPATVTGRAARVGVVCGPREARLAGAAVGLGLLPAGEARIAAVLTWTGTAPGGGGGDRPASPAARRCAKVLREVVPATACGRLVLVALPPAEGAAADAARTLLGGLVVPAALVVGGPRGSVAEELLAEQDRIVLARRADGDPELAALALAQLAPLGPPVTDLALPAAPAAAALARSGARLVSPLRGAVAAALGAER